VSGPRLAEEQPVEARHRAARYEYELPGELVAQRPAERREESRLLVLAGDQMIHARFRDLPAYACPGDLFVANDTRVLPARFHPKRRGGGRAEVLLLHPVDDPVPHGASRSATWEALVRPGQRVRVGDRLTLTADAGFEIIGRTQLGTRIVRFYGTDPAAAMRAFGQIPLPPYIKTPPPDAAQRYQTVYAVNEGSVAAPTAGLHFTPEIIEALRARGAHWTTLTLDVGAGTFRPVKTADIREHPMHAEHYTIGRETADAIARTKQAGGRIVAVGTTAVRSLEDAALHGDGSVQAGSRWTELFIYPGFRFQIVDALLTNFHLPRSTLLMLVCAFAGTDHVLAAYAEAVRERYRFYSFGDAMFIAGAVPQAPS
jgi:S-adenosylmethionine:tRNA ribosyltransferase-isomerase